MKIKLLLLITAISVSAHADVVRLNKDLASNTDVSSDLNLSVFSLGFLNSICTGTLISPEGHVLLASHCIEPSIGWADNGHFTRSVGYPMVGQFVSVAEVQKDVFYANTHHTEEIAKNLLIPLGLDNSVVYASITFAGRGKTYPLFETGFKNPTPELIQSHRALLNTGIGEGGDFAIVQIPELKNKACYRLSAKAVELGQRLRSTSFPCYKTSGDWPQVRSSVVTTIAGPNGSIAINKSNFFLPIGTFTTDAPRQECNSGTSAMNEKSEIVAVLDAIYFPDRNTVNSFYISTHRILELLPEDISQKILKLNSKCDKK